MRLININAFLKREQMMADGKQVDRRSKVLEFCDDEATGYAILSHRWIDPTEVDYKEMADLAKMIVEDRDEIRYREGYKKILNTCEQAQRDGYEWVWVDTCCIDKRSSAELSEAINSMYRWYANSGVCYAYLHDVQGSYFPTDKDDNKYYRSNGWPEWFSRGWTLQEMIAPSNVQFFNKYWKTIGDKKALAHTLEEITQVPVHILTQGLFGSRPCAAQIISWAAKRKATRVEDRAYSLMGLLDVNMPMLYGEGKKAFHRLQLEIIHSSNDQSIFAWEHSTIGGGRSGSILADDPSFFKNCSGLELLNHNEFIDTLKRSFPNEALPSIDPDCFGTFPVSNRGIHMWMVLRPYRDSIFEAFLPCRNELGSLATIGLALWDSNCYRYPKVSAFYLEDSLQFRQVHLRYQDIPSNVTFEIDDSAITETGFICSKVFPSEHRTNTLTLTATRPVCIRTYFERQGNVHFAVAFGQCFGHDWIHVINDPPHEFPPDIKDELMTKGPNRSRTMADMYSRDDCRRGMSVHYMRLPGSSWMVRTCRFVWERSRIKIRMEAFRSPHFENGLDEWKMIALEECDFLAVHMAYPDYS